MRVYSPSQTMSFIDNPGEWRLGSKIRIPLVYPPELQAHRLRSVVDLTGVGW